MARQRSSPYLSGVRSRLWRFIAVGAPAAATGRPAAESEPVEAMTSTAPVVALIRRLPLLFDE
jgi:hypothetical protein